MSPQDEADSPQLDEPGKTAASRLLSQWRLLFGGRLTRLKGVELLLDALPLIKQTFDGRVHLTVAGAGPAEAALRKRAGKILRRTYDLTIEFSGWLSESQWRELTRDHDLLVVPSVWPEPFGLVGPEAGLAGLPAAAFAVGGIPDWLSDGVNGHLAPGGRPTAKGLAHAIIQCLADPDHYGILRGGARSRSVELTLDRHLAMLMPILAAAAASRNSRSLRIADTNQVGIRSS